MQSCLVLLTNILRTPTLLEIYHCKYILNLWETMLLAYNTSTI